MNQPELFEHEWFCSCKTCLAEEAAANGNRSTRFDLQLPGGFIKKSNDNESNTVPTVHTKAEWTQEFG